MRYYAYVMLIAFILIIGSSVRLSAQTTPSGTPSSVTNTADERKVDYNYLGLLGLLGLYGLHKKKASGTVIDRRVS